MLSLESPAVPPLALWEGDLDGTGNRPLFFLELDPSSGTSVSFSFAFSAAACGLSSASRDIPAVKGCAYERG